MKYYPDRTNTSMYGLDSLFNDLFGDSSYSYRTRVPKVDVYETPNSYVLRVVVAGYKEENISVSVESHVLTVSYNKELKRANEEEKKEEKKEERKYLVREISTPEFSRSFTLPDDIDESTISAENKNGILTITLPKVEKTERGKIEVKIN